MFVIVWRKLNKSEWFEEKMGKTSNLKGRKTIFFVKIFGIQFNVEPNFKSSFCSSWCYPWVPRLKGSDQTKISLTVLNYLKLISAEEV